MKEELNTKLVEILTSIQTAAGKASDFALEQLPDIAQSYILYGRVMGLISVAASLSLLMLGLWLLNKTRQHIKDAGELDNAEPFFFLFGFGVGGVLSLIGVITIYSSLVTTALVWLAPKVWLLKELASLIK